MAALEKGSKDEGVGETGRCVDVKEDLAGRAFSAALVVVTRASIGKGLGGVTSL